MYVVIVTQCRTICNSSKLKINNPENYPETIQTDMMQNSNGQVKHEGFETDNQIIYNR